MRARRERGETAFVVRPRAGGETLCELALGRGEAALTPALRLGVRRVRAGGLSADERIGLEELRAALGLLLESLRGRAPGKTPGFAEEHDGAAGSDALLRTTFACNQRCPFCFVPLTGRVTPWSELMRELDARAGRGGDLTISGGEPASDPRLARVVAAARERGVERVVLQTNAVYLARAGFVEELARLGVRAYLVSFHSHRPADYDRITGSRGQYRRALAGLETLLRTKGCDVTVNIVVNAVNYRSLPRLVAFLARRAARAGGRRPGVYFSMMNEAGHQRAPSWAVSLEAAAPFLARAARLCREQGLPVARSEGESSFPPCVYGEPSRHASRRALPQERVRRAADFSGDAGLVGRAKSPGCSRCLYDARCLGVPAQHAALFGLGALSGTPRIRRRSTRR